MQAGVKASTQGRRASWLVPCPLCLPALVQRMRAHHRWAETGATTWEARCRKLAEATVAFRRSCPLGEVDTELSAIESRGDRELREGSCYAMRYITRDNNACRLSKHVEAS